MGEAFGLMSLLNALVLDHLEVVTVGAVVMAGVTVVSVEVAVVVSVGVMVAIKQLT